MSNYVILNNLNEMPEFPLDMKLFYNFNSSKRKKRFHFDKKKRNKLKNFFLLIPITAFMVIFSLLDMVTYRRVGKIIYILKKNNFLKFFKDIIK